MKSSFQIVFRQPLISLSTRVSILLVYCVIVYDVMSWFIIVLHYVTLCSLPYITLHHVCIYIYIYAYIQYIPYYTICCMCVYIYIHTYIHMYTLVYVYIYIYIHMYTHVYTLSSACRKAPAKKRWQEELKDSDSEEAYTYIYIYIYIHIYTHIYV